MLRELSTEIAGKQLEPIAGVGDVAAFPRYVQANAQILHSNPKNARYERNCRFTFATLIEGAYGCWQATVRSVPL